MSCKTDRFFGKETTLFIAYGCGNEKPQESDWLALTGFTSKTMDATLDTEDGTADDIKGNTRVNIGTYMNRTISGDGVQRVSNDLEAQTLLDLQLYFNSPPQDMAGQPTLWVRLATPTLIYEGYMLITSFSLDFPEGLATFSFESIPAPSSFEFSIIRNPMSFPVPTAIAVTPATPTVSVGDTVQLTATATPTTAYNGVTWEVELSTSQYARVSPAGVVTGVAAGEAIVVARSLVDNEVYALATVTVEA